MAVKSHESTEIKVTDIVFDCPHCGKSLAIDYRGAGLTIPCTDCGKHVQVPIPEGMEITDIDSTEEEQEVRILNLRRSLSAAELRIEELEAEVEELGLRRDELEKVRLDDMRRFGAVLEQASIMGEGMDKISESLKKITKEGMKEE